MRYAPIETISFTDVSGNTYAIKDLREIPEYEIASILEKNAQDKPDEVAVRDDAFEAGSEADSYRLWEANLVEIVDAGFDWTRIKKVKVPL